MAQLSGSPALVQGDTSISHTTAVHTVGMLAHDASGNQYRYIQFASAVINGELVVIDHTWTGTRLSAALRGYVGVALTTQAANAFGWVQVYGVNTFVWADSGVTTADGAIAPVTTDLGHLALQTSADTGIAIFGIRACTAPDSCASTALGTSALSAPCTAQLNFPYITGQFFVGS
jgi:hypothetical protein